MYVLDVDEPIPDTCSVRAWRPPVPGIDEVFHASIVDYAYPAHCHDTWTVLIVDAGAIRYHLDKRECAASGQTVAILPPGVIHDGQPAPSSPGFRKRNLYLEANFLPNRLIGAAVDKTNLHDVELRSALAGLHDVLRHHDAAMEAEARLALIGERITAHLAARSRSLHPFRAEPKIARELRLLLDETLPQTVRLADAATQLDRSVPHLVRTFTHTYGVSPHEYVTGLRVEAARHLLLAGTPVAHVATAVGFYDQAHLSRHFRRHTSTSPARYASSHPGAPSPRPQRPGNLVHR